MASVRTFGLVAAALLLVPACSKRDAADSSVQTDTAPDIVMQAGQGTIDLAFAVADYRHHADGTQRLLARGRYRGAPVEMRIVIEGDWRAQELGGGQRGFKGQLQLESSGAASDTLIRAMDGAYETRLGAVRFEKSTPFAAVSLEGTPQALNAGPAKLKLLYEGGSGQQYAEAFLDIDLSKARVVLREKDPQYRARLVSVLSGSP